MSSLAERHGLEVCLLCMEEQMPRELSQFERYLVHEFVDDYRDGLMSRRDMMRRVLHITRSVGTTAVLLRSLGVGPLVGAASAQETPPPPPEARSPLSVPADDPRVLGEDITFPAADGATIMAYQ